MAKKPRPPTNIGGKRVGDDNVKCIIITLFAGLIFGAIVGVTVYISLMKCA